MIAKQKRLRIQNLRRQDQYFHVPESACLCKFYILGSFFASYTSRHCALPSHLKEIIVKSLPSLFTLFLIIGKEKEGLHSVPQKRA